MPTTSSESDTTSCTEAAVSLAIFVPFSTAWIALSIRAVVLLAASALFPARLRTSSATTAKPFPAVPALAASTAAFSAKILVWNAISSIVLMILPISFEAALILSIAWIISAIWLLLSLSFIPMRFARMLASSALFALLLTFWEIPVSVAANSSTELACSVAPCESA